jgi:dienelactone hydrolase
MGIWWSASLLQAAGAEKASLRAVPESALLGMPVSIQGAGFNPGQEVILRARSEDGNKVRWESSALFLADQEGQVKTAQTAPLSGDYADIDPAGLFWSMKPHDLDKKDWRPYSFKDLDRITVTLTAETGGSVRASSRVERLIRSPESKLVRESVRTEGLVATLFYPAEGGPHPALINLGGSGGGLSEQREGLLSSHGYAVLALAYFGIESLPPECVEIPLEYFEKAIHWLKTHPAVDSKRLAVAGGSKGAELALLLGATYPDFKAVIGISPSALIWQGISRKSFEPRSSWSKNGKGLPFAPFNFVWTDVQKLMRKEPLALLDWYNPQKLNPEKVQAAAIEVERINGPVLLLSGSDDQMWPSAVFSEMMMKRLKEHGHPYADQAMNFEGSGHTFRLPYLPTTANQINRQHIVGGNPPADARASLGAWKAILDFLDRHLRGSKVGRGS